MINITDVDTFQLVSEVVGATMTTTAKEELANYFENNGSYSWGEVRKILICSNEFSNEEKALAYYEAKSIDDILDRDFITAVLECDNGHIVVVE